MIAAALREPPALCAHVWKTRECPLLENPVALGVVELGRRRVELAIEGSSGPDDSGSVTGVDDQVNLHILELRQDLFVQDALRQWGVQKAERVLAGTRHRTVSAEGDIQGGLFAALDIGRQCGSIASQDDAEL